MFNHAKEAYIKDGKESDCMYYMFSKEQIKQAIKAYGDGFPNCYYVMKYKGNNKWLIYSCGAYTPASPCRASYMYDYDAYFITDKTGKPLDIRILNTKECFQERLVNAYYNSQHVGSDTLCISNMIIIINVKSFRFSKTYCSVIQEGGSSVLLDYKVKGHMFWV